MRILFVVNRAWNIRNFRWGLVKSFQADGHHVIVAAAADQTAGELQENDITFIPLAMDSKTKNPFKDVMLILRLYKIYKRTRPDVVLHFTIKPNIYGSLAAGVIKLPCINNITGLGNIFLKQGLLNKIVVMLYKIAIRRADKVFFQNTEDMNLFLERRIVNKEKSALLPGSGIDTAQFAPCENHSDRNKPLTFLLAARMIWEKGIGEYIEAAEIVKKEYPHTVFQLAGELGVNNPSAIPESAVLSWTQNRIVSYLGYKRDIRKTLCDADCVVLPSFYREGVPRTLLEAASMGKPIVTTDNIGCREVVEDGVNGYLCKKKDSADLADKIIKFIKLSASEREAMGHRSRELAIHKFDEKIIIEKYAQAVETVLNR